MSFFSKLLESDFMPHGHCYFWKPEVLWTNVIGDGIIAIAYFTIPIALYFFVIKRKDIKYPRLFILFALFILSCGFTHVIDIISVWHPMYRFEGLLKLLTGIISIITAYILIKSIPEALKIPTKEAYQQANNEIKQKTFELEKHNEYLKNLAYATSHDLKEPVRGMSIYAQSLLSKNTHELSDEVKEKLAYIASEGQRMYNMIESIMGFSLLESEEYAFEIISLEKIIFNSTRNIKLFIAENSAEIKYDYLPEVRGNEILLTILFQNIITNSIKYKKPNLSPLIEIRYELNKFECIVYVSDNGIGFDNKYKEIIFEMFKRLNSNNNNKGSGLGLSICKRIVEIHSGTIEAISEINKGTTIIVRLPINKPK